MDTRFKIILYYLLTDFFLIFQHFERFENLVFRNSNYTITISYEEWKDREDSRTTRTTLRHAVMQLRNLLVIKETN